MKTYECIPLTRDVILDRHKHSFLVLVGGSNLNAISEIRHESLRFTISIVIRLENRVVHVPNVYAHATA